MSIDKLVKWTFITGLASVATLMAFGIGMGIALETQNSPQTEASNTQTAQTQPEAPTEKITAKAIFNELNDARTEHGLQRLSYSKGLTASAKQKCDDMVKYNYYGHLNKKTGKKGIDYVPLHEQRVDKWSEILNSSAVYRTNTDYIDGWLNSPDHKTAMLEPTYTSGGVYVCNIELYGDDPVVVAHMASYREETTRQPVSCRSYTLYGSTYTKCN